MSAAVSSSARAKPTSTWRTATPSDAKACYDVGSKHWAWTQCGNTSGTGRANCMAVAMRFWKVNYCNKPPDWPNTALRLYDEKGLRPVPNDYSGPNSRLDRKSVV